uniref:Spermatogenesis associated 6-like n=1 Tax=Xenopus tropicalis TaxID=8364 RepID=A0A803JM09_XENTR|eukprot:XP_017949798.1 PREDICTED: spermatogenesis associated 6-like protein isoform X4 [Xenopus tropicalis]
MPLKIVIELQIHAVTCPGVFLPEKDDILLNVSILGQHKETGCLPSVFPLLFHEKMRFEKVFLKAVDPAALAQSLENHITRFELIQLTHSADILAVFEENTRQFLFPEPKLTPAYPGVDREVLMKTVNGFPAVKSYISRPLTVSSRKSRSTSSNPVRGKSPAKNYSSPTKSSKSRSPSPFSRRCVNELNKNVQQQLANLSLNSSDNDTRPPFIVRHVDSSKSFGDSVLQHSKARHQSKLSSKTHQSRLKRALSYDSFHASRLLEKDYLDSGEAKGERGSSAKIDTFESPLRSSTYSLEHKKNSPVLARPLLRERFQSEQNTWESIHNRVVNLLTTHSAKQQLSFGTPKKEVDRILERSLSKSQIRSLLDHSF